MHDVVMKNRIEPLGSLPKHMLFDQQLLIRHRLHAIGSMFKAGVDG
ncbi:MAG: hypothetical protein WDO12_06930 [Pseudomonadota bacterium]